jgi:hypothetical protein
MIRLAQKVMMRHQAKAHLTPHFPREHFTFVIAYSRRLSMDFTPVLFTVCAASHMACTDIVADRWMTDVITPALADGGVGHPLGTLIISQFCPGTR